MTTSTTTNEPAEATTNPAPSAPPTPAVAPARKGRNGGKGASAGKAKPAAAKRQPRQPKKTSKLPKLVDDERTIAIIAGLAKIQCTQKEAAAVLGANESRFSAFLKATPAAAEAWSLGRESGKVSLRRWQWAAAEKSPAMQVWLGKQYLGQADRVEQSLDATVKQVSKAEVENAARDLDGRLAALFSRAPDGAGDPPPTTKH
jgi:hypothetical protein